MDHPESWIRSPRPPDALRERVFWPVYIRQAGDDAGGRVASARLIRHLGVRRWPPCALRSPCVSTPRRGAASRISHLSSSAPPPPPPLLSYSYGDCVASRAASKTNACAVRRLTVARAFVSDAELSCAALICRCSRLSDVVLDPRLTR